MQHLILKKDIEASKMEALLHFLKSWNIEAELKIIPSVETKKTDFSLATGMWKDYKIDAEELRSKAWSRKK